MAKGRPRARQAAAEPPVWVARSIGFSILASAGALVLNGQNDLTAPSDPEMKTYTFYLDRPERPGILESVVGSFRNNAAQEEKEIAQPEFEKPGILESLTDSFSNIFSGDKSTPGGIVEPRLLPVMGDMSRVMYAVPEEANPFMEKYSAIRRVPISIASNIFGSESGFKPDAVSSSNARGVGQFVPSTALEEFYKNRDHYPQEARDIINANIEQYTVPVGDKRAYRYRIKQGGSQEAIDKLAENAEVSIGAGFSFMAFSIDEGSRRFFNKLSGRIAGMNARGADSGRLDAMQAQLQRPLTAADLKTFYVCGVEGGASLLEALADPVKRAGSHRALDYAPHSVVANNIPLFYKANGSARDIVEFYEEMTRLVGEEQIPEDLVARRPQLGGAYVASNTLDMN